MAPSFAVAALVVLGATSAGGTAPLTPAVSKADKKFFGKDYPADARPKVDVLHFNHPYPVVQDSDDFDKDFVKDENNDNGSWKAQTEYDRLRHKLLKEKADLAKALKAKEAAEKELEGAMRREKDAEDKVADNEKKAEERHKKKQEEESKKKQEVQKKQSGGANGGGDEGNRTRTIRGKKTPGGVTAPGAIRVASEEVQKAMEKLEDCKKELEAARKRLKELMKELEEAKKKQEETQKALDASEDRLEQLEATETSSTKSAKEEYEEYIAAKEAYEKQQAKMAKMEKDIEAAAAKVKAIRDSADKSGGVYPTNTKSAAWQQSTFVCAAVVAVAIASVF